MRQIDAMKEKIFKKEESAPVLASVAQAEKEKAEAEAAAALQETDADTNAATSEQKVSETAEDNKTVEQEPIAENTDKTETAPQTEVNNENTVDTEDGNEAEKVADNYKGKRYNPPSISAVEARKRYLPAAKALPSGVKTVKVPARKPRYAKR